jgi:rRNA-processing protein FCF1
MANTTLKELESLSHKLDSHNEEARVSNQRMNRIEEKLDQLADAVISLARAEEKIAILMQDTKDIKEALLSNTTKIHTLEVKAETNMSDVKTLSKFFWLVMGAAVSIVVAATAMSLGFTK